MGGDPREHDEMSRQPIKQIRRQRRKKGIRKGVFGTPERPRLTVYRSLKHIYAQVIDDSEGRTLAAASSLDKDMRSKGNINPGMDVAGVVGKLIASRAKDAGINKVVFDRGAYLYHGRVRALADAAREAGLSF